MLHPDMVKENKKESITQNWSGVPAKTVCRGAPGPERQTIIGVKQHMGRLEETLQQNR